MRVFPSLLLLFTFIALAFTSAKIHDCKNCHKTFNDSVFNAGDIIRLRPIWFDLGKCTLRPDDDSVMNQSDSLLEVVRFINDHPTFTFELRAHTDSVNPYSSTRLTSCRATSVLNRLIELGADKNRVVARGLGDSEPLRLDHTIYLPSGDSVVQDAVLTHKFIARFKNNKNDWEYLRRQNRRIDLKIIRTDYLAPVDTTK